MSSRGRNPALSAFSKSRKTAVGSRRDRAWAATGASSDRARAEGASRLPQPGHTVLLRYSL